MKIAGTTITVTDKATRKLQKANQKLNRGLLSKALREGAKIVKREAQAAIPVDSGTAKRSIKVRMGKGNRRKGYIRYRVFVAPVKKGEAAESGDAFYFRFVELGTKFIKARHTFRDAEDRVRRQVETYIIGQMRAVA